MAELTNPFPLDSFGVTLPTLPLLTDFATVTPAAQSAADKASAVVAGMVDEATGKATDATQKLFLGFTLSQAIAILLGLILITVGLIMFKEVRQPVINVTKGAVGVGKKVVEGAAVVAA